MIASITVDWSHVATGLVLLAASHVATWLIAERHARVGLRRELAGLSEILAEFRGTVHALSGALDQIRGEIAGQVAATRDLDERIDSEERARAACQREAAERFIARRDWDPIVKADREKFSNIFARLDTLAQRIAGMEGRIAGPLSAGQA